MTPPIHARIHWVVLVTLVVLQLLARPIETLTYRLAIRRVLIRNGAQPCAASTTQPRIADCDLIAERRDGKKILRSYYSQDGATKTTQIFDGGELVSTQHVYWGNASRLILPWAAVAVGFVATLRKVLRTGAFFTWQLARHPWDYREKLLLFYSVPIFVTGLIQLAFIP